MELLKNTLEKFKKIDFPNSNIEDDDLAEFFSELIETDSYYIGIIESYINSNKINSSINFSYLNHLKSLLQEIDISILCSDDIAIYNDSKNYLNELEKLVTITFK